MTKKSELQEKLNQILEFVSKFKNENGFAPSVRDICHECNIKSTSSVHIYLKKLETDGLLKINKQKSRAIEVPKDTINPNDFVKIPCIGSIQAGQPRYAFEDCEDIYTLPNNLFNSRGDIFMLNVEGHSMIEAGILAGDKIIVRGQSTAENGQIVVALIDDSATVKRFYKEKNYIRLHPENRLMNDIICYDNCSVLGIVVGLIRNTIN